MCAKLVLSRGKYDSAKQALFDLHWLPIKARINFKILTTMLLSESVNPRQGLRSASDHGMNYNVPFNKKTWFIMIEASSQLDKKYGITCRCI